MPPGPLAVGLIGVLGLIGLLTGSFLTVVIWRVPRGESVLSPPPRCPSCGDRIAARDSIPVVSWLLLGRTCRSCREPISARYPVVELLTAVVFVLVAAVIGPRWELPAFLYLAGVGLALSAIDLETRRLPNALTLLSYPVMLVLLVVPAVLDDAWRDLLRAILGGLALFVFYLILALIHPKGMGMGDVKFAGVLGLGLGWLGWDVLAVGTFFGFLLASVIGLGLIALGRAGRRSMIPFGPFMYAGAQGAIVLGPAVSQWYAGSVLGS